MAVCAQLSVTAPSAAQQTPEADVCSEGRITHIFVDNHDIFDLEQLEQGTAARWAYNLANALHVRTTESFIRRELLFSEGDCLDPLLLDESGRILRQYGFIARADVFAVRQADGSHHVVVDTQDEWTTKIDFAPSFDDGIQLEVLDVTEENLLGQGVLAGAFFRRRLERRDVGLILQAPRFLGSRTDVNFGIGRTRNGDFFNQSVEYPFVGEVGRIAVRESFVRRDELLAYATGGAGGFTHALLPYIDEQFELSVAGRLGRPGNLTLIGVGVSRETVETGPFPDSVDVIVDAKFDDPAPAPDAISSQLVGHTLSRSTGRVSLMLGQRNVHFEQARGLDNIAGVQDVRLGTDFGLTVGRSLGFLSSDDLPTSDDVHVRFRGFGGTRLGPSYLFAHVGLEGRRLMDHQGPGGSWRDFIAEGDVYAYLRTTEETRHTWFLRASVDGGWSMEAPFQLTLGGRATMRGFREEDFPGAHRLLLTVEDRIVLPSPDLMDIGLTLFADAGQVWAGDAPFGADSGWKGTLGVGLRLGFPAGSRAVSRLDLGFPLGGGDGSPVFRVTAFEFLGLLGGFEDHQLRRSRKVNVGPDYFVTESR